MPILKIACVRTGEKYRFDYVTRLRNMIERNLMQRTYEMVCFTDQPDRCSGVTFIDVAELELPGWWSKMAVFAPEWRGRSKVIYFDLDTVIIRDLAPLADVPGEFAILKSPVRVAYPCRYNSSVMTIGGGMASFVWHRFEHDRAALMDEHARYGDQQVIEQLYPDAPLLNDLLPGFFCNYRDLTMHEPKAAVINFGGHSKPDNCEIPWVQREWA
jgi:hypothetical protein